ncbi:MAG: winged helix-turn-helix domain-containing protein, partial [Thaumarchaeota archaeon]|nr:winged helix-turn-helix domain-containing protein [Nitrososphaerota archaeon]
MPIPDSKKIMAPLLNYLKDGKERSMDDIEVHLTLHFKLSEEEKNRLKPSGHETLFHN